MHRLGARDQRIGPRRIYGSTNCTRGEGGEDGGRGRGPRNGWDPMAGRKTSSRKWARHHRSRATAVRQDWLRRRPITHSMVAGQQAKRAELKSSDHAGPTPPPPGDRQIRSTVCRDDVSAYMLDLTLLDRGARKPSKSFPSRATVTPDWVSWPTCPPVSLHVVHSREKRRRRKRMRGGDGENT